MTVVLAFLRAHWLQLAAGAAALVLLAAAAIARGQRDAARAERDLALAHLSAMTTALDVERISTRAAADAATRCAADGAETDARNARALAGVSADLERARAQLRACVSPDVLADRLGALFPGGAP